MRVTKIKSVTFFDEKRWTPCGANFWRSWRRARGVPRAEAEAPQSLMYPYIKIHTARRKNVALHSNLFTICSQFNCTQLNSTKVFDNIKEPPLSDGLTTPLKIVILKIQRGTVVRRLAPRMDHKVTAYFLRVGRSLCVYGKYEKHKCNTYKKAKQFPVHTHHPLSQGSG